MVELERLKNSLVGREMPVLLQNIGQIHNYLRYKGFDFKSARDFAGELLKDCGLRPSGYEIIETRIELGFDGPEDMANQMTDNDFDVFLRLAQSRLR